MYLDELCCCIRALIGDAQSLEVSLRSYRKDHTTMAHGTGTRRVVDFKLLSIANSFQ